MAYLKKFLICFVLITVVQSWESSGKNSICSTWHGLVPHPSNCRLFFLCAHGNGCIMECSKGTFFHPELKVCVWPGVADCSHTKGSKMTMLPVRRCSSSSSEEDLISNEVVPHPRPPMPPPSIPGHLPYPTPPSIPTKPHGPSINTSISTDRPIHPTVGAPSTPTPPPGRPPIHRPIYPPAPSPGQQIVFPTNKPSISPYPMPSTSERPPIHPPIWPPSTQSPHVRPPTYPHNCPPCSSKPPPHEIPPTLPPSLPPPPSPRPPFPGPPHEWPQIHPPVHLPSPYPEPPPPPPPPEPPQISEPVFPPSAGPSSCKCCCEKCQDPDYKPHPDDNHHSTSDQTHSDMSSGYPIPSDLANAIIAIANDLVSSKDKVNVHKLNGTMDKIISKHPMGQTPLLLIYRNPQDGHLELLADIINNIS